METKRVIKTISHEDGNVTTKGVVVPTKMSVSDTEAAKERLLKEVQLLHRTILVRRVNMWDTLLQKRERELAEGQSKILPDLKSLIAPALWESFKKEVVEEKKLIASFPNTRLITGTIDPLGIVTHAWFKTSLPREELNEPGFYWLYDPMLQGAMIMPQPIADDLISDMGILPPWSPWQGYYRIYKNEN